VAKLTITEALAEKKTLIKRIETKSLFLLNYIFRRESMKDPLEKDGGSAKVVAQERQGIRDMEERIVDINIAIQLANTNTQLTVGKVSRSIAEWLVWRREVSEQAKTRLQSIAQVITRARMEAQRTGGNVVSSDSKEPKQNDMVVNVSETELAKEIEEFETILGELDGKLSLTNATTFVGI
jgi:hypothetical protein